MSKLPNGHIILSLRLIKVAKNYEPKRGWFHQHVE